MQHSWALATSDSQSLALNKDMIWLKPMSRSSFSHALKDVAIGDKIILILSLDETVANKVKAKPYLFQINLAMTELIATHFRAWIKSAAQLGFSHI